MGWWLPSDPAPVRGTLDVNINAALDYDGAWDRCPAPPTCAACLAGWSWSGGEIARSDWGIVKRDVMPA